MKEIKKAQLILLIFINILVVLSFFTHPYAHKSSGYFSWFFSQLLLAFMTSLPLIVMILLKPTKKKEKKIYTLIMLISTILNVSIFGFLFLYTSNIISSYFAGYGLDFGLLGVIFAYIFIIALTAVNWIGTHISIPSKALFLFVCIFFFFTAFQVVDTVFTYHAHFANIEERELLANQGECHVLSTIEERSDCYHQYAIKTQNISVCDNIYIGHSKSACLRDIYGSVFQNTTKCMELQDKTHQYQCVYTVATYNGIQICDELGDSYNNDCKIWWVFEKQNISYCDSLGDSELINKCYTTYIRSIPLDSVNETFCLTLPNKNYTDSCLLRT